MRVRSLLLAVAACLFLGACAGGGGERTPPLPAELQPAFFPGEQGFLNDLGTREGIAPSLSDPDLVRVASRVCQTLFEGQTRADLIPVLVGWDDRFTESAASALIVAAQSNMCDQAPID